MGYEIAHPAIIEPELLACPVLSDGELTYDNGMFYFVGWSYSPGVNGAPGEYRISVKAAACPIVMRTILSKVTKLVARTGH